MLIWTPLIKRVMTRLSSLILEINSSSIFSLQKGFTKLEMTMIKVNNSSPKPFYPTGAMSLLRN